MKWLKLFSEARNDAKLRTLNNDEFRVWFNLLCLCSEQPERGVIRDYDHALLAIEVCNADVTLLGVTLQKLVTLRIVTLAENGTITFIKFAERQKDKPSDDKARVAERVRKHRENKRKTPKIPQNGVIVTPCNAIQENVTPCNADVTPIDKTRIEETREEKKVRGGGGESTLAPAPAHESNGVQAPPPPPQNQPSQQNQPLEPLDLKNPFVSEIKDAWNLDLEFLDRRDLEAIPVAAAYLGKHGAQSGDVRRYLERWAKVYPNRTLPLISQLPRTFAFVMNHPVNDKNPNGNENGSDDENDRYTRAARRIMERQNQARS